MSKYILVDPEIDDIRKKGSKIKFDFFHGIQIFSPKKIILNESVNFKHFEKCEFLREGGLVCVSLSRKLPTNHYLYVICMANPS